MPHAEINVPGLILVGRFSGDHHWPVLGDRWGPGLYLDHVERVTVSVEGAEPLYAELRLPNLSRWMVGQRVVVTIEPD